MATLIRLCNISIKLVTQQQNDVTSHKVAIGMADGTYSRLRLYPTFLIEDDLAHASSSPVNKRQYP